MAIINDILIEDSNYKTEPLYIALTFCQDLVYHLLNKQTSLLNNC